MQLRSLIAAVLSLIAYVPESQATDLFGYTLTVGQTPQLLGSTSYTNIASRFTVGSSNVDVNYINYFGIGNGTLTPSISIYTAKASAISGSFEPDTLVASTTFSANGTSTIPAQTSNFPSTVTLTANANYYIVVQSTSNTTVYNPATGQSSQFSSFGGTTATPQNRLLVQTGSTWGSFSSSTFVPYTLGLTSVPEPSTYVLGTIAAGTISFMARRCRKAHKA